MSLVVNNKSTATGKWSELASEEDTKIAEIMSKYIDILYYAAQTRLEMTAIDSAYHYYFEGAALKLDPCAEFSTSFYTSRSPDVLAAKVNPFYHFLVWGIKEGRHSHPSRNFVQDTDRYIEEVVEALSSSFDAQYYFDLYPETKLNHVDPLLHYINFGWRLGYDPNEYFDSSFYLEKNADVANQGLEPCYHYLKWGRREGRRGSEGEARRKAAFSSERVAAIVTGSFDASYYQGQSEDQTDVDPMLHFLEFGWREGRNPNKEFSVDRYIGEHPRRNWEASSPFLHWAESQVAYDTFADLLKTERVSIDQCTFAIDGCLDRDDTSRALEFLALSRDELCGDVAFRQSVRNTLEKVFYLAWLRAEKLYSISSREEADTVMTSAARQIAHSWLALDPLGCRVRRVASKRILLLANVDLRQCTFYRVEQKMDLFKQLGYKVEVYPQSEVDSFITALPGAFISIFYRIPATAMNIRAIQIAAAMHVPTIYDIDDLIFDPEHYPEPFETYGGITKAFYNTLQMGVPLFRYAISLCSYGMASTTMLAEFMRPLVRTGQVYILPNALDTRTERILDAHFPRTRRDSGLIIFYGSGTKAHNVDFNVLAADAVADVLASHKDACLVVAGYIALEGRIKDYQNQIRMTGWIDNVDEYWAILAEVDINIAVLSKSATTDAKSEIKWMEAALFGIPSIVSATDRYKEVLTHDENALIAETSDDWSQALNRLVSSKQERLKIGENAREKISRDYRGSKLANLLTEILQSLNLNVDLGSKQKKVLLVNIFFPPQTIGGSTRVVRDNLDCFLLDAGVVAEFEFGVVTSDNDAFDHYQIRLENYKGCPVYRISPGHWPNLEWNPYDPEVGAAFRHVLQSFQPDLVHFHCPQRLSGSIIQETIDARIPYITTVHDAWWISDYHFLFDDRGTLHIPFEPLPSNPPKPMSLGRALDRRRYLAGLLNGSQEILCVSDAFTKIYRGCGYVRAKTLANGVSPLVPIARSKSKNEKVRAAHIGSMTNHKGYYLLKDAVMRGDFDRVELTIVDHSRSGGGIVVDRWGLTDVYFVGKTKQELMHKFYANIDVLIAPSIWPESFGLVTREALAAGLWVIASDRGAVGDAITSGVNGWVINVDDDRPLYAVLTEINAEPMKYMDSPPKSSTPQRTVSEQSDDLISIYRDVLSKPGDRPEARAIVSYKSVEPSFRSRAMKGSGD